jgi:hypothetical protein
MSDKKRGVPFWVGSKNKDSEVDITDPEFQSKLSKTRIADDSDPLPLNVLKIGGYRHAPLPKNSSKTRH